MKIGPLKRLQPVEDAFWQLRFWGGGVIKSYFEDFRKNHQTQGILIFFIFDLFFSKTYFLNFYFYFYLDNAVIYSKTAFFWYGGVGNQKRRSRGRIQPVCCSILTFGPPSEAAMKGYSFRNVVIFVQKWLFWAFRVHVPSCLAIVAKKHKENFNNFIQTSSKSVL